MTVTNFYILYPGREYFDEEERRKEGVDQCNLLRGKIIGSCRSKTLNLPSLTPQTLSEALAQQVFMETSWGSYRVQGLDFLSCISSFEPADCWKREVEDSQEHMLLSTGPTGYNRK